MVGMWWKSGEKYWVMGPDLGTGRILQVREVRSGASGCILRQVMKGCSGRVGLGSGRHKSGRGPIGDY